MFAWSDPKTWILIGVVSFFVLFGKTIFRAALGAMDARTMRIRESLREAESIREQAENTLALYKKKYQESMKEAEDIITRARETAQVMIMQAEADLKITMERRTQQAMDRIAEEEKRALEEVRNHIVDITIAAARSLVMEHLQKTSGDEAVRYVIADLERKVH